jgi:hypothetical protein
MFTYPISPYPAKTGWFKYQVFKKPTFTLADFFFPRFIYISSLVTGAVLMIANLRRLPTVAQVDLRTKSTPHLYNDFRMAAPCLVADFNLSVDIDTFFSIFWLDKTWYEHFLTNGLEDLDVSVSDWADENGSTSSSSGNKVSLSRNIHSYHPSKMSFPGLPSHAEVSIFACSLIAFTFDSICQ